MIQFRFALFFAGLFGLAVLVTHAWAQSDYVSDDVVYKDQTKKDAKDRDLAEVSEITEVNETVASQSDFIPNRGEDLPQSAPSKPTAYTAPIPSGTQATAVISSPSSKSSRAKVFRMGVRATTAEELAEAKELAVAVKAVKDAKNDDEKKSASKTIQQLLDKQFERDFQQREEELAPVEERVKSLRRQLDKRKAAKDDIIGLRLKTILNNADGLGFPGDDGSLDGYGSTNERPAARAMGVANDFEVPAGSTRRNRTSISKPKGNASEDEFSDRVRK